MSGVTCFPWKKCHETLNGHRNSSVFQIFRVFNPLGLHRGAVPWRPMQPHETPHITSGFSKQPTLTLGLVKVAQCERQKHTSSTCCTGLPYLMDWRQSAAPWLGWWTCCWKCWCSRPLSSWRSCAGERSRGRCESWDQSLTCGESSPWTWGNRRQCDLFPLPCDPLVPLSLHRWCREVSEKWAACTATPQSLSVHSVNQVLLLHPPFQPRTMKILLNTENWGNCWKVFLNSKYVGSIKF